MKYLFVFKFTDFIYFYLIYKFYIKYIHVFNKYYLSIGYLYVNDNHKCNIYLYFIKYTIIYKIYLIIIINYY